MIAYKTISEIGDRKNNEDSIRVFQQKDRFCAALGDGLGGHGCGDVASRIVTEKTIDIFKSEKAVSQLALRGCFEKSQESLLEEQRIKQKEYGMKTTLCVLMADAGQLVWGHIGDSRIYHFIHKEFVERTFDHSVPQMLAAAGKITEQEIRRHPDRNRLLRAMGIEWRKPLYQISDMHVFEPGHQFLMCSDGFWEWIVEKDMALCLQNANTVSEWLASMKTIVRKNGREHEMDNYSAICIWT